MSAIVPRKNGFGDLFNFDEAFSFFDSPFFQSMCIKPWTERRLSQRSCTVSEKDGVRTYEVELPGVNKKDVEVILEDGQVVHVKWRREGKDYSMLLAVSGASNEISAKMEDGLLTIILANDKTTAIRKIDVK